MINEKNKHIRSNNWSKISKTQQKKTYLVFFFIRAFQRREQFLKSSKSIAYFAAYTDNKLSKLKPKISLFQYDFVQCAHALTIVKNVVQQSFYGNCQIFTFYSNPFGKLGERATDIYSCMHMLSKHLNIIYLKSMLLTYIAEEF